MWTPRRSTSTAAGALDVGGGPESSIGESTSFALRSTDTNEQTVTVIAGKNTPPLRFELKPIIRMAFLQIRRGAPESEVRVDDRQIGKVDSARIVRTGIRCAGRQASNPASCTHWTGLPTGTYRTRKKTCKSSRAKVSSSMSSRTKKADLHTARKTCRRLGQKRAQDQEQRLLSSGDECS